MAFNTRNVRQIHAKAFIPAQGTPDRREYPTLVVEAVYHYTTSPAELSAMLDEMFMKISLSSRASDTSELTFDEDSDILRVVSQDGWVSREFTFATGMRAWWFRGTDVGDYDKAFRHVANY